MCCAVPQRYAPLVTLMGAFLCLLLMQQSYAYILLCAFFVSSAISAVFGFMQSTEYITSAMIVLEDRIDQSVSVVLLQKTSQNVCLCDFGMFLMFN